MIQHYNAFISYRHAPLDMKIAEHVQKTLERFHIPDKIRKSTGKKRIERIFRDKDELPTTSDLSETIYQALTEAEYLIVICSENTKESMWVTREIEFFLSKHPRDKVLTVLASGEPDDVIPDILKSEEREIVGDDGMTHKIRVALEPLSCDYRLSRRKADKEELPRLAAALIGCSYDELMNRRRAYRIRRMSLIFALFASIAIAFGIYMVNVNMKITASLQEAMRQRSIYLANESLRLNNEGERIEALHVALASLPEDPNGPITPQSIRAITDASLAYRTSTTVTVEPTWNYYMPYMINDYVVSPEGDYLAVRDYSGYIQVWDTKTHELKMADYFQETMQHDITFLPNGLLLLIDSNTARAFDVTTGDLEWEYSPMGVTWRYNHPGVLDNEHIGLLATSGELHCIDISSGDEDGEYSLPQYINGVELSYRDFCLDQDSRKLAFLACDVYSVDVYSNIVGVLNLDSGDFQTAECQEVVLSDLCWLENGYLVASAFDDYSHSVIADTAELRSYNNCFVKAYDVSDMTNVWTSEFSYLGGTEDLKMYDLGSANGLCCVGGAACYIFDYATGETLGSYTLDSAIIDVTDRDRDGNPMLITRDGCMAFPNLTGNGGISIYKRFVDNLSYAIVNNGVFVCSIDGMKVIYYDTYISDTELEETEDSPVISWANDYVIGDEIIAVNYYDNETASCHLAIIDPESNEVIGETDLSAYSDYGFTIRTVGIVGEDVILSANGVYGTSLIRIDSSNMRGDVIELSEGYVTCNEKALLNDGKICLYSKDDTGNWSVVVYDAESEDTEQIDINIASQIEPMLPAVYFSALDKVYIGFDDRQGLVDLDSEHYVQIDVPRDWGQTELVDSTGDNIVLVSDSQIVLVDEDGAVVTSMYTYGKTPMGIDTFVIDDVEQILVIYSDGALYRYSAEDLTSLGVVDTDIVTNYLMVSFKFEYDEENNCIYVMGATSTSVIDTTSWYEIAFIENSLGHHHGTDRFFVMYDDPESGEAYIGCFRHYTVQELIDKAYEALGDSELPEYVRAEYGI